MAKPRKDWHADVRVTFDLVDGEKLGGHFYLTINLPSIKISIIFVVTVEELFLCLCWLSRSLRPGWLGLSSCSWFISKVLIFVGVIESSFCLLRWSSGLLGRWSLFFDWWFEVVGLVRFFFVRIVKFTLLLGSASGLRRCLLLLH